MLQLLAVFYMCNTKKILKRTRAMRISTLTPELPCSIEVDAGALVATTVLDAAEVLEVELVAAEPVEVVVETAEAEVVVVVLGEDEEVAAALVLVATEPDVDVLLVAALVVDVSAAEAEVVVEAPLTVAVVGL